MLYLSNDESEVINSPLLGVLKIEITSVGNVIIKTELEFKLELVKKLLQEASIEGFNLLFSSE